MWCCKYIARRSAGPTDHHRWWRATHVLQLGDWGVGAHSEHLSAIEKMGCYDALDVVNLAGAEVMFRQLQLIEYAYARDSPLCDAKGDSKGERERKRQRKTMDTDAIMRQEAAVFAGAHRDTGDLMCSPDLLEYVGKEIEKDASVMKQVRKAREERRLLQGPDP